MKKAKLDIDGKVLKVWARQEEDGVIAIRCQVDDGTSWYLAVLDKGGMTICRSLPYDTPVATDEERRIVVHYEGCQL